MSTPRQRPIVIASNRGPLSYREHDGQLVARRGGGGLVSGLAPLVERGEAVWIAAALSDADRAAAASGRTEGDGLAVHLLALDESDQEMAYDAISNETLWFVHHGLFDQTRDPAYDVSWWQAWQAYRRVNERFADAIAELAPEHAVVLVQDYHLTLAAPLVAQRRADLRTVHFHHTPFAGPDGLRVLPPAAREEMLESLAAHDACGFHTPAWAANFSEAFSHWPHLRAPRHVFASTLSSDVGELGSTARSDACQREYDALDARIGDRSLLVRVDRMELSKNIVRGFRAFDLLLERRPDLHGRVEFLACCYPSRENVEAYAVYRREVDAAVRAVNDRWATTEWTPVRLETDDDFPRSVAALRRYDVLVVNPIRDGLNLVAKEGPAVNEHDGQLVLSTEAGAYSELSDAVDAVDPFDLVSTAEAMAAALDRTPADRSARAERLRRLATERTPADWLADQLAAVG